MLRPRVIALRLGGGLSLFRIGNPWLAATHLLAGTLLLLAPLGELGFSLGTLLLGLLPCLLLQFRLGLRSIIVVQLSIRWRSPET